MRGFGYRLTFITREDAIDHPNLSVFDNHVTITFQIVEDFRLLLLDRLNEDGPLIHIEVLFEETWNHVRDTFPAPDFVSAISGHLNQEGLTWPSYMRAYLKRFLSPIESRFKSDPQVVGVFMTACKHRYVLEETQIPRQQEFCKQIPATEESIKALEEFKVPEECQICLEKVHVNPVKRMPCSHIFHSDCIVRWLRKSHVCPLCRFQMPIFK